MARRSSDYFEPLDWPEKSNKASPSDSIVQKYARGAWEGVQTSVRDGRKSTQMGLKIPMQAKNLN